jgi:CheY-like chemotaxis protein
LHNDHKEEQAMPVIAIFNKSYCSVEEITEKVAQRLGYTVASQEVLKEAVKQSGIPKEKIARAMIGSRGFLDSITREWERSLTYVKAAVAKMLETDDQIIFGPATYLIPRNISHVLRVEIVATREYRIKQAMELEGINETEAVQRIEKADQDFSLWNEQILSFISTDPFTCDIKIPLPSTSVSDAVDVICENVAKDALKPTPESLQAVADFQLAAKVRIALVSRKQYSCNVSVHAGKVNVIINQKSVSQGKLARTVRSLRFENAEDEVRKICAAIDSIKEVHVRPGAGYRKGSRTLLVDDERDFAMTLSERLETRDIESDVVYDGQQALTFMETGDSDVMVLDLGMPGMDGFEILQRIKRDHPMMEVIIVTGHSDEKEKQTAYQYGAFHYFEKPVNINELAEKIKEASEKAQRNREKEATRDDD